MAAQDQVVYLEKFVECTKFIIFFFSRTFKASKYRLSDKECLLLL